LTGSQHRSFVGASQWAGKGFGPTPSKLERDRERLRQRHHVAKRELSAAETELARAASIHGEASAERGAAEARRKAAEKRLSDVSERLFQTKFRRAASIARLPVEEHEVATLATVSAFIVFLLALLISPLALPVFGIDLSMALAYGFMASAIGSVGAYYWARSYPFMLARRQKVLSLGRAPEAVCYMAMSMQLAPSLDRAVAFGSEHSEEPLSSALRRVPWDVYTRRSSSVEGAYRSFVEEWGEGNEEMKMSFQSLMAAAAEREPAGRKRVLAKANEVALDGTKHRIEEYAAGLAAPSTILFALGILLPLVVGSILPLAALGNMSVGSAAVPGIGGATVHPAAIVLMMDVIFPLAAFAYASTIISKRPGTSTPQSIENATTRSAMWRAIAVLAIFSLAAGGFVLFGGEAGLLAGALLALGGVSLSLGYYLKAWTRHGKEVRERVARLEAEFPDALFQLGRRVDEGLPLEVAMRRVADAMKGTEVAGLFSRASSVARCMGVPMEEALFDPKIGVMARYPSRTVAATMSAVIDAVGKDPSAAGKMMADLSGYLRDLRKIDQNVKVQLGGTVDNMQSTATLFAPLIMGVTVGLYALLGETFASLGSPDMMPLWLFALVLGVYLMLMVVVISHFSANLLNVGDTFEFRRRLGTALPLAWAVYAVALAMSYMWFA
jgi:Flp pilus assembly protein TadB